MSNVVFVAFLLLSSAAIVLGIIKPASPVGEGEVCWSCGQRGQHKLWCPNR